jgi:hypothetical protein
MTSTSSQRLRELANQTDKLNMPKSITQKMDIDPSSESEYSFGRIMDDLFAYCKTCKSLLEQQPTGIDSPTSYEGIELHFDEVIRY